MKTVLYIDSSEARPARMKYSGACRAAHAESWHVQHVTLPPDREHDISEIVSFWNPLGVIIDCGRFEYRPDARQLLGTPTVFLDASPIASARGRFRVVHDSHATARLAARELMSLGLPRYGFVGHPRRTFWSEARRISFCDALELNNIPVSSFTPPPEVHHVADMQPALRSWISNLTRPVGILAANDRIAAQVLSAALASGASVPKDIVLVGIDNDETLCEGLDPTLTSIEPDYDGAGYAAGAMLAHIIRNPGLDGEEVLFGPLLTVRRASTLVYWRRNVHVSKAMQLIRRDACRGLTAAKVIESICASMGISRRMAELRFRECTGSSILAEIQSARIARACQLLASSQLNVNEISSACGYDSANAFCRLFTRQTGLTPLHWRKNARAQTVAPPVANIIPCKNGVQFRTLSRRPPER